MWGKLVGEARIKEEIHCELLNRIKGNFSVQELDRKVRRLLPMTLYDAACVGVYCGKGMEPSGARAAHCLVHCDADIHEVFLFDPNSL